VNLIVISIFYYSLMSQFSKSHLTALWSVKGIGFMSFKRCLFEQKKNRISDEDFWVNREGVWQKSSLSKRQVESIKKFKKEHNFTNYYHALKTKKVRVLLDRDRDYPPLLKMIAQAPPVLFVKSNQKLSANFWQKLFLSVVGTRRITSYGRLASKTLLRDIIRSSQAKLVSGFMYGVDVEAMKIAHQLTQAIGILGYGFDYCYPRHQQSLMEKMLEEGAVFLSEYPPTTQPSAGSFVQRNRIIAGLAQAVMIIEAAENSGSLITAQNALDEGRTILAVPGPISNPYSRACHKLIQKGAHLVASVEDFYSALHLVKDKACLSTNNQEQDQTRNEFKTHFVKALSVQEEKIIKALRNQGTALSFDQLAQSNSYKHGELAEWLLQLQIKKIIKQEGQNYILKS
jgi:DNA processing protein